MKEGCKHALLSTRIGKNDPRDGPEIIRLLLPLQAQGSGCFLIGFRGWVPNLGATAKSCLGRASPDPKSIVWNQRG